MQEAAPLHKEAACLRVVQGRADKPGRRRSCGAEKNDGLIKAAQKLYRQKIENTQTCDLPATGRRVITRRRRLLLITPLTDGRLPHTYQTPPARWHQHVTRQIILESQLVQRFHSLSPNVLPLWLRL